MCLQSAPTTLLTKNLEETWNPNSTLKSDTGKPHAPPLFIPWGRQPKATNQTHTRSPKHLKKPSSTRNKFYIINHTKFGFLPNSTPYPIRTQYLHRMPYGIFTNHVYWTLALVSRMISNHHGRHLIPKPTPGPSPQMLSRHPSHLHIEQKKKPYSKTKLSPTWLISSKQQYYIRIVSI